MSDSLTSPISSERPERFAHGRSFDLSEFPALVLGHGHTGRRSWSYSRRSWSYIMRSWSYDMRSCSYRYEVMVRQGGGHVHTGKSSWSYCRKSRSYRYEFIVIQVGGHGHIGRRSWPYC